MILVPGAKISSISGVCDSFDKRSMVVTCRGSSERLTRDPLSWLVSLRDAVDQVKLSIF